MFERVWEMRVFVVVLSPVEVTSFEDPLAEEEAEAEAEAEEEEPRERTQ